MSSLKRIVSSSSSYPSSKKKRSLAKKIPRAPRNMNTFITRCVNYDFTLGTDANYGFGFSPTYLWVNDVSTNSINGASDISGLFEMCRIVKVKMILLPTANVHETTNDSVTTGVRNIPYVYYAPDYSSNGSTTQSSMNQMDGLRITSFDHPIQLTVRPKLSSTTSSGILLSGSSWVKPDTDVPYNGIRMYIDVANAQTYLGGRAAFIITFECKNCK